MYKLEIETENSLTKIRNPRKAKAVDIIVSSLVKVMDGDGIWHTVESCWFQQHAKFIADDINRAISKKKKCVCVDL